MVKNMEHEMIWKLKRAAGVDEPQINKPPPHNRAYNWDPNIFTGVH